MKEKNQPTERFKGEITANTSKRIMAGKKRDKNFGKKEIRILTRTFKINVLRKNHREVLGKTSMAKNFQMIFRGWGVCVCVTIPVSKQVKRHKRKPRILQWRLLLIV